VLILNMIGNRTGMCKESRDGFNETDDGVAVCTQSTKTSL